MKILHLADAHLDSPMNRLPADRVAARRRELFLTFSGCLDLAERKGAKLVLIAGDLFDTETPTPAVREEVADLLARHPNLTFCYLPGNHEGSAFSDTELPNLHVFGAGFHRFDIDDVSIYGRSDVAPGMWNDFSADPTRKNIVMLHGDLADHETGGKIGLAEAAHRGIDYLALGHYHTCSQTRVDDRAIAVYPGTPEGRGFDETGDKGVVLLDTDDLTHPTFIKTARRTLHIVKVDVERVSSLGALTEKIARAIDQIPSSDLVRVVLTGAASPDLNRNPSGLLPRFEKEFFAFELRDECTLAIDPETYRYEKSLKGEFIRLVMADASLSDEEKNAVILRGLKALRNEGGM